MLNYFITFFIGLKFGVIISAVYVVRKKILIHKQNAEKLETYKSDLKRYDKYKLELVKYKKEFKNKYVDDEYETE